MGIPAPFDNMECIIPSPFRTVGMVSPVDASNCRSLNSVEMAPPNTLWQYNIRESKILSPSLNVEVTIPSNV